eukprot:272308_1
MNHADFYGHSQLLRIKTPTADHVAHLNDWLERAHTRGHHVDVWREAVAGQFADVRLPKHAPLQELEGGLSYDVLMSGLKDHIIESTYAHPNVGFHERDHTYPEILKFLNGTQQKY